MENLFNYQKMVEVQENESFCRIHQFPDYEKQRYKDLYDFAPISYLTLNERGNIIQLNYAASRLFGGSKETFKLSSIYPLLAEESKAIFHKLIINAFSFGGESGELTFLKKDKNKIYTKVQLLLYLEKEKYQELCWMAITDITKEKKSEQELRELNATKDKFFSIVSHDLKGPMGSIVNMLEVLQDPKFEKEK